MGLLFTEMNFSGVNMCEMKKEKQTETNGSKSTLKPGAGHTKHSVGVITPR